MPMAARPKIARFQQLNLFRPRPTRPRWQSFSTEIQRKTLMLLARMLRTSYPARLTPDRGEEASDE
jgi:hypothetical protein